MIALIPSLRDWRLSAVEFLTFLRNKSSLNNLAFSTNDIWINKVSLTIGGLTGVMATGVEKVCVELVLKKLSDGIAKTAATLHHSHLGLSSGNLLIVISLDGLVLESLQPKFNIRYGEWYSYLFFCLCCGCILFLQLRHHLLILNVFSQLSCHYLILTIIISKSL